MNTSVASIDLTLADLSIAQNNFPEAEKYIKEGSSYAKNSKMMSDFEYTNYQLEYKRKNYEKALSYLTDIYRKDSSDYKNYVSQQIALLQDQFSNAAKMSEIQIKVEKQKNTKYLFWGSTIAAFLLMIVIVLLVANVKRKNETNKRLTELNGEVSRQKDNLDRINHHLEEIIDERTKDLQIKNKKLSEYSSYLSHQIRGPIATLKGLLNLEKEKLVDEKECISMMDKCVSEIDDKIIDMSDMLHDPERTGF
jgi:signal transduction histidine kinase